MNFFDWYYNIVYTNLNNVQLGINIFLGIFLIICTILIIVFGVKTWRNRTDVLNYKIYKKNLLLSLISVGVTLFSAYIVNALFWINSQFLKGITCTPSQDEKIVFFYGTVGVQLLCLILCLSILILLGIKHKTFIKIAKWYSILILLYLIFLNIVYC